jgi:GAF domain-containing protein
MTTNANESDALEQERLEVLDSYQLLNSGADEACDRIAGLAAGYFDVPAAFITLIDSDHAWVKSAHGLAAQKIARRASLSTQVVTSGETLVVEDARADARFARHTFVVGEPGIAFYAAAPLVTGEGFRLGALGVLDYEPRTFSEADRVALEGFARTAVDLLDLRLCISKTLESLGNAFREGDADHLLTVCAWTRRVLVNGEWLTFEQFLSQKLGYAVTHGIHPDAMAEIIRDVE